MYEPILSQVSVFVKGGDVAPPRIILRCVNCKEEFSSVDVDPFPVCDNCLPWEEDTFKENFEETFLIRRRERDVYHGAPINTAITVEKPIKKKNAPENISGKRPYVSDDFRWNIFERDNFTCVKCGSKKYLTLDHIVPVSLGGVTSEENAQTLCRSCNSRKGAS
jgi:hypothetical protein